jgi:serine phosphatase RsbU (regulator of sigma subunit)
MVHPTTIDIDVGNLQQRLKEAERALEAKEARLERQLELAAKVHNSLLPQPVRHERICVDVKYLPVEEVGGDYCQVRFADAGTCYITMCDVTGHGIGPALMAARVSSEVRHSILYGHSPRDIVSSLNRFCRDHFADTDLYLTFVAARIDLRRPQIIFSGAGHPSPLLIRRDGLTVERLKSQNPMIGVMDECLADEPESTTQLDSGDRLVFYTDGLTETADADGRYLGDDGLEKMAVGAMSVDLFDAADHILDRVSRHQQGPATDDKTLIVVEIK